LNNLSGALEIEHRLIGSCLATFSRLPLIAISVFATAFNYTFMNFLCLTEFSGKKSNQKIFWLLPL
jgi:hypothetical protein